MTKDDIIEMAYKAGGYTTEHYPDEWRLDVDDLYRFASLVAAAEREACAKLCDAAIVATEQAKEQLTLDEIIGKSVASGAIHQSKKLAAAIRARGQYAH